MLNLGLKSLFRISGMHQRAGAGPRLAPIACPLRFLNPWTREGRRDSSTFDHSMSIAPETRRPRERRERSAYLQHGKGKPSWIN